MVQRRQEVVLAESSPNAGDGCNLLSDGMYVVAVYVEDTSGTLAFFWGLVGLATIFWVSKKSSMKATIVQFTTVLTHTKIDR